MGRRPAIRTDALMERTRRQIAITQAEVARSRAIIAASRELLQATKDPAKDEGQAKAPGESAT